MTSTRTALLAGPAVALALATSGCGSSGSTPAAGPASSSSASSSSSSQQFPDVVDAELTSSGDGFDLSVTLSSPYDSPDRYADGWRVLGPDGAELGSHTLTHDHADEQPVTRSQSGLQIPDGVDQVTIEGSDTENGYGGDTLTVDVPR